MPGLRDHPGRPGAPPIPWYFKLMLLATVVYLGWRIYQLVHWAIHHI